MAITVRDIAKLKSEGKRFVLLTAYDFTSARILDDAGVQVILVGDTLAQVMLGYDTTLPVTVEEMIHHIKAVSRGAQNALVVGDMPFGSYGVSVEQGIANAIRLIKEGGAHAVKFEGPHIELTRRLVDLGIPVMAHVGLTPQSFHALGGNRVQGRTDASARKILDDALALQDAGAFALVLEAVPASLAERVTKALAIPTIGVGAGRFCDAQGLVLTDLLGMGSKNVPKFVKAYAQLREVITTAVHDFLDDVGAGAFPDDDHSYH
ncbi:MAG: 3-methyl-2-oxobutanoate hydroxymethyltransferase [Actinomycetota bacterium]|nr:3-methyl-2-oxobutanoate hydroxymethyltransferase [Actinomycetota bacterium]